MVEYTDYSAAGRPAAVPSPALRLPPSTPLLGHLLLLLLALPSPLQRRPCSPALLLPYGGIESGALAWGEEERKRKVLDPALAWPSSEPVM